MAIIQDDSVKIEGTSESRSKSWPKTDENKCCDVIGQDLILTMEESSTL